MLLSEVTVVKVIRLLGPFNTVVKCVIVGANHTRKIKPEKLLMPVLTSTLTQTQT